MRRHVFQVLTKCHERLLELVPELPKALAASLDPEGRRTIYSILGLRVEALTDGSLKASGVFGEETSVWEDVRTSTR